jgi:hypothetical protein
LLRTAWQYLTEQRSLHVTVSGAGNEANSVVGPPSGLAQGTGTRISPRLARAALFVFVIYFTTLDAIGGIGLGRTILVAQELVASGKLGPQQLAGVESLLNALWVDPVIGGVGSFVSETASWATPARTGRAPSPR